MAQQRLGEVCIQIHGSLVVAVFLHPLGIHVAGVTRELEVIEQARRVIHALLPVVVQALVKHVRLHRVERRRQRLRVGPDAVQPRLALRVGELDVHIRRRRELSQPRINERLVRRERRHRFHQRIQLLRQKRAVNRKRTEAAVVLRAQFREDQFNEPRRIGPRELAQKRAAVMRGKRHLPLHEILQRLLRKSLQPVVPSQRIFFKDLPRQPRIFNLRRQIRFPVPHLLLVVVRDAETLLQIPQCLLRCRIVCQQRLAIHDDPPPCVLIRKTLLPQLQNLRQLRRIPRVLVVQRVEVIIVLAAGDEFAEDFLALRRECEFFNIADFIIPPRERGEDDG